MESMTDIFAWGAILLPVLVAAVLTGRLLLLHRREAELGWELAAQKESRAAETEQRIRLEHAAELARTIHDDLGHRLTLAAIEAAVLRTRAGEELTSGLEQLRASISECVESLNRSVTGLSVKKQGAGLKEGIEDIVDAIRRAGASVQIDFRINEDPTMGSAPSSLAGDVSLAVVREGCTNALRHAPGSPILIRARTEHDEIVIDVENEAAAEQPATTMGSGRGLQGLAIQVEDLGGSLNTGPRGDGWLVHARVPLHSPTGVEEARRLFVRRRRRTRRMLIALPLATASLMIVLPVGAVLGQAALSVISPADFSAVSIGLPESVAHSRLPVVEMESPPRQLGSGTCRHYESTFSPFERTEVYEVCFAHGQVSSTTIIPAP